MEANKNKCLQFCWLGFLYSQGKMGFTEKADNLKLLPNYSHEHRALFSQMKVPKCSVARLHARRLRSGALVPIDPHKVTSEMNIRNSNVKAT